MTVFFDLNANLVFVHNNYKLRRNGYMKNDILRRLKKSNLLIYRNFALLTAKLGLALALVAFAGCGGSGGDGGIAGSGLYTVSGTVSGLVGTVVLQDNGADDLSVSANGAFTFATEIADGAAYHVTVKTQPSGQTCTASSNTGTIAGANVTNVSVVCRYKYVYRRRYGERSHRHGRTPGQWCR